MQISRNVSQHILVRIDLWENLIQNSYVLFKNLNKNKCWNAFRFSNHGRTNKKKKEVSNENMCEKHSEPHNNFDINPSTATQTTDAGEELFNRM